MSPVARVQNAIVTSSGFPLLSGATLTIEGPSLTILTGANGAGKTSLLRLLAGLVPLAGGDGEVLGVNLARDDRRTLRRRVGWLGHEGSFYDDLTAKENLRFAASALQLPAALIDPALARVDLTARADTVSRRLSAGQRRRLGLAWLLVRRPALWLLDEPFATLDAEGRDFLDALLADVVRAGATVVLSSHDPRAALAPSHRTVVLAGGRVVNEAV